MAAATVRCAFCSGLQARSSAAVDCRIRCKVVCFQRKPHVSYRVWSPEGEVRFQRRSDARFAPVSKPDPQRLWIAEYGAKWFAFRENHTSPIAFGRLRGKSASSADRMRVLLRSPSQILSGCGLPNTVQSGLLSEKTTRLLSRLVA